MTSKNLSFKYLVRHHMTSRLWAVALGILGCLGSLLLPVFIIQQNYKLEVSLAEQNVSNYTVERALKNAQESILSILSFDNPFIKLVLIVLAILCGVAMFRYLHERNQVDFFHALPVKRGQWFAANYVSGVLLVLPIYLIVLFISIGCANAMGLGGQLNPASILQGIVGNILYFLLNYSVTVLCTILTGNTIITVLLVIWAEFSLTLLMIMVQAYQAMFYETFVSGMPLVESLMRYGSPICNYLVTLASGTAIGIPMLGGELSISIPQGMAIAVYPLVLTIVLAALSYFLFCRRKSENSGMAIAFPRFRAPLKWYMCVVSGFAFSLLFVLMFSRNGGWMWFGLIFGVILCHMVVEIVYAFDFKSLLAHWKQMIALSVVAVALIQGIKMDIFGYDRYVPSLDSIASASLESNHYTISESQNYYVEHSKPQFQLTDQDSIATIQQIAQLSVENNTFPDDEGYNPDYYYSYSYMIHYTLKNGNRVSRQYNAVPTDVVQDTINKLICSTPYIEEYSNFSHLVIPSQEQGTVRLEVFNSTTPDSMPALATTISVDTIQKIVDQLHADMLANAEKHLSEVPCLQLDLYIDFFERPEQDLASGLVELAVYPSDTASLALIQQLTGVEPATLTHENVQSIEITSYTDEEYAEFMQNYNGYNEDRFYSMHTVTVTDPQTLDTLLASAVPVSMYSGAGYMVESASGSDWNMKHNLSIYAMITGDYEDSQWSTSESLVYLKNEFPQQLIEQLIAQNVPS